MAPSSICCDTWPQAHRHYSIWCDTWPQAHRHHSTAPSSEMYAFGSMLQSESQTMAPSSSSSFHGVTHDPKLNTIIPQPQAQHHHSTAPSSTSSFHRPKRRDVRDDSTCLAACFNRNHKPCPQAHRHHSTATMPSSSTSSFYDPKLRDVRDGSMLQSESQTMAPS